MSFKVVIPARYASTRFPGKVLQPIAGRPMVQHVYERACDSGADEVIIATDDGRVAEACDRFGARVCMTSPEHRTGTDRIAQAVTELGEPDERIIVNLQGDEPLMPPALIRQVAHNLGLRPGLELATLRRRIELPEELFDPHVVKVVCDHEGYALYFSRAPIPWHREKFGEEARMLPEHPAYYRHLGLYAYRVSYLKYYATHPPCELESTESLEQLRALNSGHRIHVDDALEPPGEGVDTPQDLERVIQAWQTRRVQ